MRSWSRLERGVLALGVALYLPSLAIGRFADDWVHRVFVSGTAPYEGPGPLQAFHFQNGLTAPPGGAAWSLMPWWGDPDFCVRFLRPLSSLTHWLDVRLWPDSTVLPHAVSVAAWGLLLAATIALYRDLASRSKLGAAALPLALLMFALDDGHGFPIAWTAGRNSVLVAIPAVLAIRSYVASVLHRRSAWAAAAWLAFGFLWGEAAVGAAAFALSAELFLAEGSAAERLRRIAPVVAVSALWLGGFVAAGFGATGSSVYLSPFSDTAAFLSLAPTRFLLLMGAQIASVPAELPAMAPHTAAPLLLASAAALVGWAWLVAPVVRTDRVSRFLLVGGLLSTLPFLGTFPSQRLMLLPGLGLTWLTSAGVMDQLAAGGLRRWIGGAVAGFHTVVAALLALAFTGLGLVMASVMSDIVSEMDHPSADEAPDARIILLSVPESSLTIYLPLARGDAALPTAGTWWAASAGTVELRLVRTGPRSLRLAAASPGLVTEFWQRLVRRGDPLPTGWRGSAGDLVVEVTDGADDRVEVREVELVADLPLDDPRVWLLAWQDGRLARLRPPPIGGCLVLPVAAPAPAWGSGPAPPCPGEGEGQPVP